MKASLIGIFLNIITAIAHTDSDDLQITTDHHHKITRRSPLEIGYIVGFTSPDASHHHLIHHHIVVPSDHHPVIIHHHTLPTTPHQNPLVVITGSTKTKIIKTDTHDVVVHESHIVHDPPVVHDTHGIVHEAKPHVLHETHVISHDIKASRHPDIVLIPIGPGHTVTLKHHHVINENPLRSHPGGYGVGVDFGGHGAGHGFYVNHNNFF